ncbi:uncharacterized protein SAPINGB_P005985 [Magnusiomyces paraingens]|uniref:TauD/TfdA-like domain-containing protein n=1 Tax=Magnusiomyces paraingens TaxID=2606893 RepID=A0A5E8C9U1_9ASCO|nr:uncharacterized protein SAPINGB_P005985 [Saprochaete ingens]VVT57996.1 unnamed protein product [Saprochaete ingens]
MSNAIDFEFHAYNENKFPKFKDISGPSPFWNKYREGPSFIFPESQDQPLLPSGKLDELYGRNIQDKTPLLGSTYSESVRLVDLLKDDDFIRDLAIKISQRGVVIFKKQDDITVEQQKELVQRLGLLSGKPPRNGRHIHPVAPAGGVFNRFGIIDPEIFTISNRLDKQYSRENSYKPSAHTWHSDITFEPVPADYSLLRMVNIPPSGGDTFWANGYALYEKLSPSFRLYLETLTGTFSKPNFKEISKKGGFKIYSDERGAPENIGDDLIAIHPVVRTNPVTGWKSVFSVGQHFTKFNEVTPLESELLKNFIWNLLVQSYDIHARHKWDRNDIAIWDNRSTYHAINLDVIFYDNYLRTGIRTIGIGERPYLNQESTTQTEGLSKKKKKK